MEIADNIDPEQGTRWRRDKVLEIRDPFRAVSGKPEQEINMTLAATIAKALAWQEEFESGNAAGMYRTLEDFTNEKRVDRSYVGRLLRLTSLSPALVEKILDGYEPDGISLRQFTKGIPTIWNDQI